MSDTKTTKAAPPGYSDVCPYLMVDSIEKELEFLEKVFGGEIREHLKDKEGNSVHAEIRIGDTLIMLGKGNEQFPSQPGMNYVYVHDVNSVYNHALNHNAVSIMAPEDRFYGLRDGGFKDPQGNTWWVAQHLRTVSHEELQNEAEKK
ncbi:MAG: VOC family protein [Bacteroidetes bacterium]|mgnify:CR=1 FL=1|nr:MAG: VOC family protein [Bacteroidota bacterium]REK04865.1 MAG: VOC family protein [Bacteroidota bacterium]REK36337.1 MAG: VOC family protein [Bacteroidota bacterium]REK50997.1 MAG: VOC family protein [Bacteroidota bacterium]